MKTFLAIFIGLFVTNIVFAGTTPVAASSLGELGLPGLIAISTLLFTLAIKHFKNK